MTRLPDSPSRPPSRPLIRGAASALAGAGRASALACLVMASIALAAGSALAATIHVPSQAPTIQEGLAAAGDSGTVVVAPGTYTGVLNRDLDFAGTNIRLVSSAGPSSTIIDCEGAGRAFYFHTGEDSTSVVEGFTVRNGVADYGGAIRCQTSSPTILDCVFESNEATQGGGSVHSNATSSPAILGSSFVGNTSRKGGARYLDGSAGIVRDCEFADNAALDYGGAAYLTFIADARFEDCVFRGNTADKGGAIYSVSSESSFDGCTFLENEADVGAGAYLQMDYNPPEFIRCTFAANDGGGIYCQSASPIISCSIFAFDRSGQGVGCLLGSPTITRSFVYGNAAGDSLCGEHADNRFVDPRFCGVYEGDVALCANSPCLPAVNGWGEEVGALPAGCPDCDSAVWPASWGAIKALFR